MGGAAIKSSVRVNAANLQATYELAKEILEGLGFRKFETLGSFGKKGTGATYGDIDIAIPLNELERVTGTVFNEDDPLPAIQVLQRRLLGAGIDETAYMRGIGVLSFSTPIVNVDGEQPDSYAQVDLMFTGSLEYSRWMYHAPSEGESRWKGLYRNVLLMAIAKVIFRKVRSLDDYGEPLEWEDIALNLTHGLRRRERSRIGARKTLKVPKTLGRTPVSKNAQEIVSMLLGPDVPLEKSMTFEEVWSVISDPSWEHHKKLPEIVKTFKEDLPDGVEVPVFESVKRLSSRIFGV
jgi:hypothetical protein